MRLSKYEHEKIKEIFIKIFNHGSLYLFGSRVDDSKKGGDIDLYVIPENYQDKFSSKKMLFLLELKKLIGEQKIDLVIDRNENRPIDTIAKQQGILLCKN